VCYDEISSRILAAKLKVINLICIVFIISRISLLFKEYTRL